MSRIITFYSYKGGVGRTFALANIGVLLAKRGKRVLLMDWDLEAPGLDRYFQTYLTEPLPNDRGLIHLLHEAKTDSSADWHKHVVTLNLEAKNVSPSATYTLSLLSSGVAAPGYAEQVRSFGWAEFFAKRQGGPIFERWRQEWKEAFDFILLDSRTGITDAGGVCTILLPDFLVLVFTANDQSFEGGLRIVQNVQEQRKTLVVQRPPLSILPLLSRFDSRDEVDLSAQWLQRMAQALTPLYSNWLPRPFTPLQIIERTKIPYVTRFSFGEPLPSLTHSLTNMELPGFYLDNCARLLISDFAEAGRIIDPDAPAPVSMADRLQSLLQRVPIDESELYRLLSEAEAGFGEGEELAELLNQAGMALQGLARYSVAEPLYRRALAMQERRYGPNDPQVASLLNNLASLLTATNRLTEAEPLMRRALAIAEKNFGPEHANVATHLNNLAQLLQDTNRLDEAESLMRQALKIDEQSFGPEHPNVAVRLRNLAGLLQVTNRFTEAEPLIRRALEIDEHSLGPEHSNFAASLNNLAQLLYDTNRLEDAEPLMRRSLEIDEQSFGPNHPKVAVRLSNLAGLLQVTNRFTEAEPLMWRSLEIDEQSFGPEHPNLAYSLNSLAGLLGAMDSLKEAEPLLRRSVIILLKFTRATGYEHTELRKIFGNYRRLLEKLDLTPEQIETSLATLGPEAGFDAASWQSLLERIGS